MPARYLGGDPKGRGQLEATNGSWSQGYTCDGFGNLTGMQGAAVQSYDPATSVFGLGHGCLDVSTPTGSYVVEGFNNNLNPRETDYSPANDDRNGSVLRNAGRFVCLRLPVDDDRHCRRENK
jgi:hypothetical protein